jgi:hypothetical protein
MVANQTPTNDMTSKEIQIQIKAALSLIIAVGAIIRENKNIPNGVLYSLVMGYISLENYNRIIQTLKENKLITESNHVLTWVGSEAS